MFILFNKNRHQPYHKINYIFTMTTSPMNNHYNGTQSIFNQQYYVNQTIIMSNKNKLITSQFFSGFTQWLDIALIFSVPVISWQASPSEITYIAISFGLSSLLIGPFIGAYLDKTDPKTTMLIGAIFRLFLNLTILLSQSILLFTIIISAKGLANVLY